MEGDRLCLLEGLAVVVDRRKIMVDEGLFPVLPGGSFEGTSNGNLEFVGGKQVDPLFIS